MKSKLIPLRNGDDVVNVKQSPIESTITIHFVLTIDPTEQYPLAAKLWDDGALVLEDRKEIVSEISGELFHLKNSVEKHRPQEKYSAIRERIARTNERILDSARLYMGTLRDG